MNVIINGVNSDTINGLQILSLPPITKPRMRTSIATIDGRPGDIVTPLGYEAYNKTIKILLHDTYDLPAIMAYFNQSGTIIFSNDPDMVYTFETIEQINYERAVKFKTASVTIHVQPYKTSASEQPSEAESESFMDSEPYLFRASGDATMQIDEIVGGSVSFNQLCNAASVTVANGHKYFMKKGTAYSLGASTGTAITGLTSGSDMVIDLTLMFGSTVADYIYSLETATAGAGVAFFRSLFSKPYYAYNAGEIVSVSPSAHKMVGKNVIDIQSYTEKPSIVTVDTDGTIHIDGTISTVQYVRAPFGYTLAENDTFTLSANNASISPGIELSARRADGTSAGGWISLSATNRMRTFTPSAPGVFFQIQINAGTYNDVTLRPQLEAGSTATSYEPYTEVVYPLSSIDLRGIPTIVDGKLKYDGDVYKSDGTVTRNYGIVDLGTLNWSAGSDNVFYSTGLSAKKNSNWNIRCSNYAVSTATTTGNMQDKECKGHGTSSNIYVRDTAYSSASDFKTAMSGVYLVYELATPTTESADPYTNPQVCYPDGTEEYIDERTIPVPVGHNTKYLVPIEITVTNSGNTDSAPSLTITGSGAIEVTIDGLIAFEINMPSTGQITIDAQAMDAMDSDNNLANRNVSGDYNNLRLSPGSHTIIVNGDASSVSIRNASRWL